MAQRAIDRNENALAVILAHAASEVFTERAFKLIFSFKQIDYIYDNVLDPVWEYNNLKSKKARDLYKVTTGDDITKDKMFWSKFRNHVDRRNRIAHRGETATCAEAQESCQTVKELIEHIDAVLEMVKPTDWGNRTCSKPSH